VSLFRRKPKPVPLTRPLGTRAPVLDVEVTRRFTTEINQIISAAKRVEDELLPKPPPDAAPLVAALHRLAKTLVERWWPAESPDGDRSIVVVLERTVLGAAFALTEQQQGRLVPGQIDPLVWQAIAWQQTALPDDISGELGWGCIYALPAGYYLARVGEEATPELVASSD
jgi:hypothetical protein